VRLLTGGCRVFSSEDGQISSVANWTARSVISRGAGADKIRQTFHDYSPGVSPAIVNPVAEEALYVIAGEGICHVNGSAYPIRPGCAVFVPPGAAMNIENPGPETIRIVSACCPEDPNRHIVDAPSSLARDRRNLMVHEDDRDPIRAGKDRVFRYLVYTDLGCRQITQFAGWIPPSKAPFHYHTYEEGIFILEGRGIVHTETESCEFGPGNSIYFPIGVRHCVENPGDATIKLLGAFYPSGSPGAAYEDERREES